METKQQADRGVALVTGCSSGFGLRSAVGLARAGFRVVATMRNLGRRGELDAALQRAGVSAQVVPLDVCDARACADTVAHVEREQGPVAVLVNNAGIAIGGFFEQISDAELRQQFETNFFGAVTLMRAVLPAMRSRRRGRIINVSSLNGQVSFPGLSGYAASKFALEGLSEALRVEMRPWGIKVVLVEPGIFKTDLYGRNRLNAASVSDPQSPYYALFQSADRSAGALVEKSKADPAEVARVVVRAATARSPALRYAVGVDAKAMIGLKASLPSSWFEALVAKVMGIANPASEGQQLS